ncbi:MAG: hypothetical protein CMF45_08700 [Legionellales bacterium]|nr:hypothetical protein [Legionellales bacterium]
MKYEQKDIATNELKEADYNPRQITANDFDALKDSIRKFGMAEPLVVNSHEERKNVVIGGHQRLRACRDLDIESIPCFVVSLPLEEEQELNIRLNRNQGSFDYDVLANLFDGADLLDWGFTGSDLDLDLTSLPEDGEEDESLNEPKKFEYKMGFNNADEMDSFYEFIAELKTYYSDEEHPSLSEKFLQYTKEHPIQT